MNRRLVLLLLSTILLKAEVKLPPYQRQVLPNGVVVYLMPKSGVPLVNFRVIVKGGRESEPQGLAGISSISAKLLRKGTATRTSDQFSNELDTLGGTFREMSNEEATVITSEFMKKDFFAGLDLTSDAVLHPSFPDGEVSKALAQGVDEARSIKDNPQVAIRQYFSAFFYGQNHAYGRVEDESSICRMTRDNISDYVKHTYVGKNMILIVAGDFDETSAVPAIRKIFGAAPAGKEYEWVKGLILWPDSGCCWWISQTPPRLTFVLGSRASVAQIRTVPLCF